MKEDHEPIISIREAAKWLARMAAKDGVVSSNEKMLLKEFAEKYDLDSDALCCFIALGLGGHPTNPETFYLIPNEFINDDGIIDIDKCENFRCDNTPEDFLLQISEHLHH